METQDEQACEKCGAETGGKLLEDEKYNFCNDCNVVTY